MKKSLAIELLERSKGVLAVRYGVTELALFGSTARDGAGADSDVDVPGRLRWPGDIGTLFRCPVLP
jgi:predicted nucleotidyltransferase